MANPNGLKSVRDTYLYKVVNNNGALDKIIGSFMTKGVQATHEMLKQPYGTIETYFKFPSKASVMDAVKDGSVVPMLYPKGISANNKVPTSLPFILTKGKNGNIAAVAVIDNWAKFDGYSVSIDPNKLYCFIEGAYVARGLQVGYGALRHSTVLYTEACSIYAHMFTRVLNRDYALNVDKDAYSKVLFLAAKFFLINLLGMKDSDMVFNYAVKATGNVSPIAIKRLNDAMPADAYTDISTFIQGISKVGYLIITGLNELTVRDYVAKFIRMYHNSSLFALEHFSYFMFAIIATINRAHINDMYAWDAAIGSKSGEKLYAHIVNAVSH